MTTVGRVRDGLVVVRVASVRGSCGDRDGQFGNDYSGRYGVYVC